MGITFRTSTGKDMLFLTGGLSFWVTGLHAATRAHKKYVPVFSRFIFHRELL